MVYQPWELTVWLAGEVELEFELVGMKSELVWELPFVLEL